MFPRKNVRIAVWAIFGFLIFVALYLMSRSDFLDEYLHQKMTDDQMTQDVTHVCLSVDEKTLIGAVAAINSVKQNTRHPVSFHILVTQDAYAHLRRWIDQSELKAIHYEVHIFETEHVLSMIRVRLGSPDLAEPMNYARFYYPELFPELHGNVIHIDNDCIVQGDVHELRVLPIAKPNIAAFCSDCSSSGKRFSFVDNMYHHYLNFHNDKVQAVGMNRLMCSFNTGVYVFNIDRWRSENVTKKIEYWMTLNTKENIYGNEKAGGGSQPPVMIVLYGQWVSLDPLWNVRHLGMTKNSKYSSTLISQAKLLHWSGPYKPWLRRTSAPFTSMWQKYHIDDPAKRH